MSGVEIPDHLTLDGRSFVKAACVGCGVIGAGWAARFLLNGIDVAVYDPALNTAQLLDHALDNAERAWRLLTQAPLPRRGRLTVCTELDAALCDAQWVQESVPERLDLKRGVLTTIDAAAAPDVLIGSSTSGLLPSDLQSGMQRPERFFVAHPYNPVYLLPLVELVAGNSSDDTTLQAASGVLAAIGMKPVIVRKEIDAFIGDRLLESVWREALWLIRDDVCDVETLDDVMRFGFGLRWAQMGLFETYRIAGGEAGMRHFLEQFGPSLAWPWTRLMDVPALDAALIDKISTQSDAQSKGRSIWDLERIRDENLVGIMHALKAAEHGEGWGAGALLKTFEERLWSNAESTTPATVSRTEPLLLFRAAVSAAWIDYNGHMTEFRYLQVLGDATDALLRFIGVDAAYVATGRSYYTVESHIRHLDQVRVGDSLYATTHVLGADSKRLHLFHRLYDDASDSLVATGEHLLLHVDAERGRSSEAATEILAKLEPIVEAHAQLPWPDGAGRHVAEGRH